MSASNFDGHFVISESGSPTNTSPCLRTVDDHLAPLAERVGHLADVAHGHGRAAVAVLDAEGVHGARVRVGALLHLAGELVA